MKVGIVVSEFNAGVTSRMLDIAKERAIHKKVQVVQVCTVAGTFDMPVVVDALLSREDIQGVVTLGAVIKGQTKHDEVISHATARALTDLAIHHKKPVSLGITGPSMQVKQAYARIRPVAERAIDAVIKTREELERIQNTPKKEKIGNIAAAAPTMKETIKKIMKDIKEEKIEHPFQSTKEEPEEISKKEILT